MSETEGQDVPDTARRSYESATERLDQIISRLDSGDAQLRETLELAAVDDGLKELRLEDLAKSLTPPAQPAAEETD